MRICNSFAGGIIVQPVLISQNTIEYMSNIRDNNCLPFVSIRVHPWFDGGVRDANLLSFLCSVVYFYFFYFFLSLFVFMRCSVYPVLPLCLDFPFLIAPLVFSNVYNQMVWFGLWYLTPLSTICQLYRTVASC